MDRGDERRPQAAGQTSRASIQRLIRTVSEEDVTASRVGVVQRVWRTASAAVDKLEEIADGYQQAIREADAINTPLDARRLTPGPPSWRAPR